ncbi:MAG: hypothetical protein KGK01_18915 [Bradyrhizobium sp.]|uniref:hypothetical protein n=1 Tax=Bradyrhizobium sp. TaxID=376 RepID=UPI001C29D0D8|nr:hypothetical protein [Bradyrhizobium sp.]MBU6464930.1 hypothetical protein [Pseudomonadota bacterium]MDE2066176.1 hypothetical protein [Bradyrhizobium sp.]MDE2244413.1 hypothetical protein [Bradyrhizobium sp.]MDE2468892.1 hypothetical protein [Bradyrhizobium sp.]
MNGGYCAFLLLRAHRARSAFCVRSFNGEMSLQNFECLGSRENTVIAPGAIGGNILFFALQQ